MPAICDGCGTANRDKAAFCSGCANRLRAIEPSGPSALETFEALRSPRQRQAQPTRPRIAGATDRILPAETTGFWLRLVVLGVAMTVGFMAWYLYITRKVTAPSPRTEISAAPSSEKTAAQRSLAPPAALSMQSSVPTSAVAPTPTSTPASTSISTPAPGPAPTRVGPPAPDAQDMASERAIAQPRTLSVEARSKVETPRYSRAGQLQDPSSAAVQRPLDLAAKLDDPGPPIAVGPGPRYDSARLPSRLAEDPGPPVALGPGPLYDSPRVPARTPSGSRDDSGPPIAIGPGPLVDYSARGVRSR